MKAAYPGAPGAFSHEACLRFLPEHEPVAVPGFADVVDAVASGVADRGVLPVFNNEAGETGAHRLIQEARLRILAEHVLPVRMHLLGTRGARLQDIRVVASHPVALRQCESSLADLGLATEAASNTAIAAKELAGRDRAVLASEAAAKFYDLAILRRDMHDRPDNATTFAVVARSDA